MGHPNCQNCYFFCKTTDTCDTPCAAYLTWYDDHMALARKKAAHA